MVPVGHYHPLPVLPLVVEDAQANNLWIRVVWRHALESTIHCRSITMVSRSILRWTFVLRELFALASFRTSWCCLASLIWSVALYCYTDVLLIVYCDIDTIATHYLIIWIVWWHLWKIRIDCPQLWKRESMLKLERDRRNILYTERRCSEVIAFP